MLYVRKPIPQFSIRRFNATQELPLQKLCLPYYDKIVAHSQNMFEHRFFLFRLCPVTQMTRVKKGRPTFEENKDFGDFF